MNRIAAYVVLILLAFIFASTAPAWQTDVRVPRKAVTRLGERLSAIDSRSPSSPAPLAWGIEIYATSCAACHRFGHDGFGIGCRNRRPLAESSPRDIYELIAWGQPRPILDDILYSGRGFELRRAHPAYPAALTESEKWAVVAYVYSGGLDPGLRDGASEWLEAWESGLRPDTPDSGYALYERLCASCHGNLGYGNGPLARDLIPAPRNLRDVAWLVNQSDRYLFTVIRDGKLAYPRDPDERDARRQSSGWTGMPWWGDYLDDEAIWRLVEHLRSYGYSLELPSPRPGILRQEALEKDSPERGWILPDSNPWTWQEIRAALPEAPESPPAWLGVSE